MNREEVFLWVSEQYGAEPDYPWKDRNAVLRHANRKWFAVVLSVSADKLGLESDRPVDVINVKCHPNLIGSLRMEEGFHPAYHMNKDQWISIRLDGSVPPENIQALISMSYELTMPKAKTRRNREHT